MKNKKETVIIFGIFLTLFLIDYFFVDYYPEFIKTESKGTRIILVTILPLIPVYIILKVIDYFKKN